MICPGWYHNDVDRWRGLPCVGARPPHILYEHDVESACGRDKQQCRLYRLWAGGGDISRSHPAPYLASPNVVLLLQMTTLLRKAKLAAATDLSPDWLQPFMRAKQFKAGEAIFRKGEHADLLYMVVSGEVVLPEIDQRLSPGDLFGEVGLFSIARRRTQPALAETNVDL